MNIFDFLYEDFKFKRDQPIKLFEAFAGIGTQHMALKRLGVDVELVGIAEVDKYAIQSYEAIHGKVKNYGGIGSFERFPKDIDICTWSFPCQDISLAGKQSGMEEGTRSNYGYVFLDTENYIEHESLGSIDNARRAWKEDKVIGTITTHKDNSKVLLNNPLRIRKLTPLEAWRLMGIDDEDFYKAQSIGTSNSQLYKQAGNAIVVDVLVAIFKELIE